MPFVHAPAITHRTRAPGRQHAIDDDLADGNAVARERVDAVAALRHGQFLGQRHPDERRLRTIAQALADVARLIGEHGDQLIGRLRASYASELLTNETVLVLKRAEDVSDGGNGIGRRQQAQRMARGSRVDDDQIVKGAGGKAIDLDDAHQLVDAGNREIEQRVDIRAIQPGPMFQDVAKRTPVLPQPACEGARRIELQGLERSSDPLRRSGQPGAERIAQGVRGIGRDDQNALAFACPVDCEQRRGRRLSYAAFASEVDETGVFEVRSQKLEVRREGRRERRIQSHFYLSLLTFVKALNVHASDLVVGRHRDGTLAGP